MLLRLVYLGVANAFALLRLLPMSDRDKDAEILALRHQLVILQRQLGTVPLPKIRPRRSGCMFVFVQDAAESVASSYVEPSDSVRVGDRDGQRME